jgi:hypothetical protein
LLEEGKLGGKHQAHLLKGKGKMDHRDRVWFDTLYTKPAYAMTRNLKGKTDAPQSKSKEEDMSVLWKDWTCGESCYKKRDDLEEKVKCLEGDVSIVMSTH